MGMQIGQGGASGNRGRGYKPMAEINVTPFVDVMMVLLVVFMVAAPLLTAGVPIDLPDSEARAITTEDNKPIEITLDRQGRIFVGETEVKQGRLIPLLSSITNNDSEKRIYIRADASLDYGVVMKTLGSINKAGYRKVALISNPSTKTP